MYIRQPCVFNCCRYLGLLLVFAVSHIAAQKCLLVPCGKLACDSVSCKITSQADCVLGEEYLYPGIVCECCGACVNRTVEKGSSCATRIRDSHVSGCSSELCCSVDEICVEKTTPFGA